MTKIFIDDREIDPPMDCSSICQILEYVDKRYLEENSVVRQIRINGYPYIPKELSDSGKRGVGGRTENPDRIEIYTGNIVEIARDSISGALAYLDRIDSLTPSLAASFRMDPSPDSLGNLRKLYEGFYWLDLLLDRLGADFPATLKDALIRNGFELEYHQNFIASLKRLKESQEKGDYARVSDLLEQEVLPIVPLWRKMLTAIAQKVGGTQ